MGGLRKRKNKGFFSIDALLALMLLLMVSTSFLNLYEKRKRSAESIGTNLEAKMVGDKLAAAIDTVYVNGPNFRLSLELPENVGAFSYRIRSDNLARLIIIENPNCEPVKALLICKNFKNFVLDRENLGKRIQIFWENSQIWIVTR